MTTCINCGAPLKGNKCQYCGTEYNNDAVVCNLSENDYTGILNVGGKEYQVYLGHMEGHIICGPNSGRDMYGRIHRDNPTMKHTFSLIEI